MIQYKSLLKVFLLTLITFGIYYFYFLYKTTAELNQMAGDDGQTRNPRTVVLLTIFTLGIYELFWIYQMGNRMQELGRKNDILIPQNGASYLLWQILGTWLCGVGILLALMFFITNFNILAMRYNDTVQPSATPIVTG